jgi:hypothetical protein
MYPLAVSYIENMYAHAACIFCEIDCTEEKFLCVVPVAVPRLSRKIYTVAIVGQI